MTASNSLKRIGLVMTHMDPDRIGGAETYCRKLVATLAETDLQKLGLAITIFAGTPHEWQIDHPQINNPQIEIVPCKIDPRDRYRRILWEQLVLPRVLKQHRLDLVHFPYNAVPIRYRQPYVVTVHDSQRFHLPDSIPKSEYYYRSVYERAIARHASHVIGVSDWDLGILRDKLSIMEDRSTMIPYGVNEAFRVDPQTIEQLNQAKTNDILWVGRPYARKNVRLLLEAMAILKDQVNNTNLVQPHPRLRVIGLQPGYGEELPQLAQQFNLDDRWLSLEPAVPHDQLPAIFQSAKLFCYPSLYESVAIPVLEAMSAGTPVLCSDIAAFQSLYSNAAQILPRDDPNAWAEAITRIFQRSDDYASLQKQGFECARTFTWENTTHRTLVLYQTIGDA